MRIKITLLSHHHIYHQYLLIFIFLITTACSEKKPDAESLYNKSANLVWENKTIDAIISATDALAAYRSEQNTRGEFIASVHLVMLYYSIGQHDLSYEVLKSTTYLDDNDDEKGPYNIAVANYLRFMAYYTAKTDQNYGVAEKYLDQLLKLDSLQNPIKKENLYMDLCNKAEILVMTGKISDAEKIIRQVEAEGGEDNPSCYSQFYTTKAKIMQYHGKQDSALYNAEKSLVANDIFTDINNNISALNILMEIDSARGNMESYIARRNMLEKIQHDYQSQRIYHSTVLMHEQNKMDRIRQSYEWQHSIARLQLGLAIAMIVILALVFIIFYRRNKAQKKVAEFELRNKEIDINRKRLENELLSLKMNMQSEELSKAYQTNVEMSLQLADNAAGETATTPLDHLREIMMTTHGDVIKSISKEYPELTDNDLLIIGFTRMELSPKEIAKSLGISPNSLTKSRYRLRKKLSLDSTDDLMNFIMNYSVGK